MTNASIAYARLHNQLIVGTQAHTPEHIVKKLGAVQGQDYLGALWGIGLRAKQATESSGPWKRTLKKDSVEVQITYLEKDSTPKSSKMKKAVTQYSSFIETTAKVLAL